MKEAKKDFFHFEYENENYRAEKGFSLVEVTISMVILMIVLLGVFVTFTYAINFNAGNNSRSQALAVLQQQVEQMRSAKFTPEITDPLLVGGTRATQIVTSADGGRYKVNVSVDNDLSATATGIQSTNEATTSLKEVSVTVALDSPTPGWQTSLPATVILRRVKAN